MILFSSPLHWLRLPVSAQHSSQSPVSLTSDASSPRPYVSPRNGTPQSNQKSLLASHSGSMASSQTRVSRTSKVTKEKSSLMNGPVLLPLAQSLSLLLNLSGHWLHSSFATCPCLFRPVCLQVNKDQSPHLRRQKNVQRTPELSSREGTNSLNTLPHTILFVMMNCLAVKGTNEHRLGRETSHLMQHVQCGNILLHKSSFKATLLLIRAGVICQHSRPCLLKYVDLHNACLRIAMNHGCTWSMHALPRRASSS